MNLDDGEDAWDAGLHPHEYGDQSGHVKNCYSWDDDHSITDDSDCGFSCDASWDNDDNDSDDDGSCCVAHQITDERWNLVYTTSITVLTATETTSQQDANLDQSNGEGDHHQQQCCPPALPQGMPLKRESSSKVRFCEQPPQEHSYEHCSRAEHAQLYYSVHELQKFLEELRMETAKRKPQPSSCGGGKTVSSATTTKSTKSSAATARATTSMSSGMVIVARST